MLWKDLISLFKGGGLVEEAFDEALRMLEACHGMYSDAVASLHREGAPVEDIYTRDREINKLERSIRRKIVTHMSVSTKPDVNEGLVLTAIVIDIERIGDYTKNIVELAEHVTGPFDALELDEAVRSVESTVEAMFDQVTTALRDTDESRAREAITAHAEVARVVEENLGLLADSKALTGRSGHAVTVALYLRYLKRVSAHLKNVATSVVNPYYRIGFREKDEEGGDADD